MADHTKSVPKCVEDTIPEHIKFELGVPPTKDHIITGLETMLSNLEEISALTLDLDTDAYNINDTALIPYVECLYDFVYYRSCDMEKIFLDHELSDFIYEIWSVEIVGAIFGLNGLLNAVRYQTAYRAGDGIGNRHPTYDAAVHFIQLAFIQSRLEFGINGTYMPNHELRDALEQQGKTAALFTNQEIEFISSLSPQSVSNAVKKPDQYTEGILRKVATSKVLHWAKWSQVPDYLNPRQGNEIGNKQSFITLPSLQSWLASKKKFMPTQFIHKGDIPAYTQPDFFKKTYLGHIKALNISDKLLCKKLEFNESHLKSLKKGKRGLFFRQALLLDNLIHEHITSDSERYCFRTYHSYPSP